MGVALTGGAFTETSCTIPSTPHVGDAAAKTAYGDFLDAYSEIGLLPLCDAAHTLTGTLAGITLPPDTYCFDAAAALTGTLTLDGPANGIWIFRVGTGGTGALSGTNFNVVMTGGGQPCNVFWWAAQGATLTDSIFQGTILAGADITLTRTTLNGDALAGGAGSVVVPTGAVTLTGGGSTVAGCIGCLIPATSENISSTSWNKFNVPPGTAPVVWVHASFKPSDISTTTITTVLFTGVSFVLNGNSYPMPNGLVIFDPAAPSVSTTTFDAANNLWLTTINPNFISDENFFVGAAIPVDPTIIGGGKATIYFSTQTNDTGLSFSWQWSAAAYTSWPLDLNSALIQSYHGKGPTGSQHAGTPNNTTVQKSLIKGPRGGGGSNFTGSWSATGSAAPGVCIPQ